MCKPTTIKDGDGIELIQMLKRFDGAMEYDGDASCQVIFKLANGRTLRFGVTDDDVADHPGLMWIDQYGGLTEGEQKFFSDKK